MSGVVGKSSGFYAEHSAQGLTLPKSIQGNCPKALCLHGWASWDSREAGLEEQVLVGVFPHETSGFAHKKLLQLQQLMGCHRYSLLFFFSSHSWLCCCMGQPILPSLAIGGSVIPECQNRQFSSWHLASCDLQLHFLNPL